MGHLLASSLSPFNLSFSWSVFLSHFIFSHSLTLTLTLLCAFKHKDTKQQREKNLERDLAVHRLTDFKTSLNFCHFLSIYNTTWIPWLARLTAFKIELKKKKICEPWSYRPIEKKNIIEIALISQLFLLNSSAMRANRHLSPASDFRGKLSENVTNVPKCRSLQTKVRELNICHHILPGSDCLSIYLSCIHINSIVLNSYCQRFSHLCLFPLKRFKRKIGSKIDI